MVRQDKVVPLRLGNGCDELLPEFRQSARQYMANNLSCALLSPCFGEEVRCAILVEETQLATQGRSEYGRAGGANRTNLLRRVKIPLIDPIMLSVPKHAAMRPRDIPND